MFEVLIKVNCPHCQSSKVVKNGKKKNGTQNLLCHCCRKQFQAAYQYKGANPATKRLILRLLERNNGIRDIEELLQVSRKCILDNLCRQGNQLRISPAQRYYRSVQIDGVWSFVGKRREGKYWLLYAYCPETDEVLAYSCGGRGAETVRELLKKLEEAEIGEYCTDHWKAFAQVIPNDRHRVGKAYTKNIEGVNTCLRARNRRLVRKTTGFSKKKENHNASLNLMFNYRNNLKARHHTF
jgi:IS1 family transposase/transposase-like protein